MRNLRADFEAIIVKYYHKESIYLCTVSHIIPRKNEPAHVIYFLFLLIYFWKYIKSWKFFHDSCYTLKTYSFKKFTILEFYLERVFIVACIGYNSRFSRNVDISSRQRDFSSLKCENRPLDFFGT